MKNPRKTNWKKFQKLSFGKSGIGIRAKNAEAATVNHARKFVFERINNVRLVQRRVVLWMVLVGVLILAAAIQFIWFQNSYTKEAYVDGGTYSEAVLGPVDSLNPLFAKSSAEKSASRLMFSSLYRYDKTGKLNYDAAEKVEVNDAETVYTVKLRDDVYWHDGQKLTADDVVFTVNLMKNPDVRTVISGWSNFKVDKVDNITVRFELPAAYAPFASSLTFPIVPKHILGGVNVATIRESEFSRNPIGTGPFKFRFTQDIDLLNNRKTVYLSSNQDYFKGSPKLDKFQLNVYGKEEDILQALKIGEVNAASDIQSESIGDINSARYDIEHSSVNNGVFALMNMDNETLSDLKVRQALRYSLDINELRKNLSGDLDSLSTPILPSQVNTNLPSVPSVDVEKARVLLNEAGWTPGDSGVRQKDGKELRLEVVGVKGGQIEKTVEFLSAKWKAVGVAVDVNIVDPVANGDDLVSKILRPRNFAILVHDFEIGGDPDVFAFWHSSQANQNGLNFSNYKSTLADDALISARGKRDLVNRAERYKAFTQKWIDDIPAIGLYRSNVYYVHTPGTKTYDRENQLVSAVDRYADVQYWAVNKTRVYTSP